MKSIREWPEELDFYSSLIGKNRSLTQGPGGNTSFKLSGRVWVKASGFSLADADTKPIFCCIERANPSNSPSKSNMRPSIEAYLHAYVPQSVVFHVHSIGSIALGIRSKLKREQQRVLEENRIGTLSYIKPGESLAKSVLSLIEIEPKLRGVLLKNHGLVMWGENFQSLYHDLLFVEGKIQEVLQIDTRLVDVPKEMLIKLGQSGFLTPDHVVFSHLINSRSLVASHAWVEDLKWCLSLALNSVGEDETVSTLTQHQISELLQWDLEKERQRIQN
jgi:rhamnose utilization protein RhaD (predicted bifunctional aldolase and dehydrogenase)